MKAYALTTTDGDGRRWWLTDKLSLASSPAYATRGTPEELQALIPAAEATWRPWAYLFAVEPCPRGRRGPWEPVEPLRKPAESTGRTVAP
jgi:hypothetical protein